MCRILTGLSFAHVVGAMPRHLKPEIEDVIEAFCGCRRKNMVPLSVGRPELALEWCYEKNCGWGPEDLSVSSSVKVYWTCPDCFRIYKSTIQNRSNNGSGCPYCGSKLITPQKSLAVRFPKLASQWFYEKNGELTPETAFYASVKEVWWICKEGQDHIWKTRINSRTNNRKGQCPFCWNSRVADTNSLAANFPEIASSWHPTKNGDLKPSDVVAGSNERFWWKCQRGHVWQASPNDRTRRLSGCPKCYRKRYPKTMDSLV